MRGGGGGGKTPCKVNVGQEETHHWQTFHSCFCLSEHRIHAERAVSVCLLAGLQTAAGGLALYVWTVQYGSSAENKHVTRNIS